MANFRYFCLFFAMVLSFSTQADDYKRHSEITIGASKLNVTFTSDALWQRRDIVIPWIQRSAEVVTDYFGRFPVKQLNIALIPVPGREVQSGWVFGGKHPIINVHIGENIDRQAVQNDWVMVHEMVHLAFPDVEQRWIEEGIATYVESVSRASMGDLSARYVWRELIKRMPQGQPQSGDRGLDRTPTWGRTYWGGAMFCLVADVEIRRRTDNRYGLKDALRAILGAGYNMNHQAELADVLSAGDEGVGVSVLTELYNRHKYEPIPFDLEGIWQNLGVELSGLSVKYNSDAPMGEVRRKIMPDS